MSAFRTENDHAAIPCPPATGRIGWTVYERHTGRILGWIRRAPNEMFRVIPTEGPGDPAQYVNVRHAAESPFLS